MTNGEKIKEIFPNTKIITQYDNPFGDRFIVFTLNTKDMQVNIEWWNAEYKEPTTNSNIPFLMHKEMDVPISECQKAYDIGIAYLRSQGKLKG